MSNPKPWKNHLPSPHDHLHDSSTLMGPPAGPLDPDDDGSGGGGRDSQSPPSSLPHQHRQQRKGGGTKAWMVVESGGWSGIEEFGKHAIMRRAGLPARDLRILDPMLSYPSTILGRERAIVVKLEHIKAIITANEVLVLNSKDPLVDSFLRELKLRIAGSPKSATEQAQENDQLHMDTVDTQLYQLLSENDESTQSTRQLLDNPIPDVKDASTSPSTKSDVPKVEAPKTLPFEFRVLELCLECACRCLETETSTLEQEAYPALDELTSQISTLNLERVRQIKSRLVAISGRVQKVRDELEHLLDDDMDMAEMYLTDKLNRQQLEETDSRGDTDDDLTDLNDECEESSMKKSRGSNENLSFSPNIEELEMLLEAYFVQTEGILNKLSALREYVDDTEDYINIMLDDKQNQLLQMGVILSTATLLISAGIAVVAMLGTNIHISIYDAQPINFWETTFGCLVSCIVLFISAITWGKRKGLLS